MIRDIVKIDEELCDGCGECVPNCHEGALQIIDDKARLVSDLMCDGLGACIGHCPQGAITIEQREAEAYDEVKVMREMVEKGRNTVIAHLSHLLDHNEVGFLKEGVEYLKNHQDIIPFDVYDVIDEVHGNKPEKKSGCASGGCPGSKPMTFKVADQPSNENAVAPNSELQQWPVQLHLVNPTASYFQKADLLLAADCSAFAMGDFHSKWLKGKALAIACPKLDSNIESYIYKLSMMIEEAKLNTITVLRMEVPCCGGLENIVNRAVSMCSRKVPVKSVVVNRMGTVLDEEWI